MKIRTMLIMLLCVVSIYSWTANLPPNEDPKEDPKKDNCCPDDNDPDCNGCVNYQYEFGRAANETQIPCGRFSIFTQRPSLNLFSPINLYYYHPLFTQIVKEEIIENQRTVQIMGLNREAEIYVFQKGENIGYPGASYRNKLDKTLVMLDANQEPTTDTPIYYRLQNNNGSSVLYSVSTRQAISYKTETGRILTCTSKDLRLEVIYNNDGSIQQVFSGIDGLVEVDIVSQEHGYILGYETRIYAPTQVGEKNDKGLYTYTGSPHTVYRIQNPNHPQISTESYTDPQTGETIETMKISPPEIREVIITKIAGAINRVTKYTYSDIVDDWIMNSADGVKIVAREKRWNSSKTECTEVMQIKDAQGKISYQETSLSQNFSFGNMMIEKFVGTEDSGIKTWYSYHTDSNQRGSYGKLASERHSSGMWKKYFYDNQERITKIVSPFKDQSLNTSEENAQVEYFLYTPVDAKDSPYIGDPRPRVKETKINGFTIRKEYFAYYYDNDEYIEIHEQCQNDTAEYGNASNMRTEKRFYASNADEASAGRLKSVQTPDGKVDSYFYSYGNYIPATSPGNSTFQITEDGLALCTTIVHGTINNPNGIANKTTKEELISDAYGNQVMKRDYVCINPTQSSYEMYFWTVATYNAMHKILNTYNSKNEETNSTWNCCQKESFIDESGSEYTYIYDDLLRMITEIKKGYGGQEDLVKHYTYDANNKKISETISCGALNSNATWEYDLAGRLISQVDHQGLITSYAYTPGANLGTNVFGQTITVTNPGGFTTIQQNFCDGRIASITGDAQISQYFNYGVNSDGSIWEQTNMALANSPRWQKRTRNMVGQIILEETSGFGGIITQRNYYNAKKQLVKATRTGQADTLYEYDEIGNIFRTGMDINGSGTLELASSDQILEKNIDMDETWRTIKQKTYATFNDESPTTISITKERIGNFTNNIVAETQFTDIWGNTSSSTVKLERSSKKIIASKKIPESTVEEQIIIVNGLRQSFRTTTNIVTTFSYDGLERLITIADPRTGNTTISYYDEAGKNGLQASITDAAGNVTNFDYDVITGRKLWEKNALDQYTRYSYDSQGNITNIWGENVYPVSFEYDIYGQKVKMVTYRNTSENFMGVVFPTIAGDCTTWTIDSASGLTTAKNDPAGHSVTYSYSVDGKLIKRIWARGLTTQYSYDQATGNLLKIDYTDTTPDVVYTYNRLNFLETVQDAAGQRTFSYNSQFALTHETINGIYNKELIYSFASTGVKGRFTGLMNNSSYEYDNYGRVNKVNDITFTRKLNSNLLNTVTRPNGINTTWNYEQLHNWVSEITDSSISSLNFTYNPIGNQLSIQRAGVAFSKQDTRTYSYNSRNELITSSTSIDNDYAFTYTYDSIGNRLTASQTGINYDYMSNELNQYKKVNSENLAYDFDGNIITNGQWTYSWDGENRLKSATDGNMYLEFEYDYLSRRISKKVYNNSALIKHTYFIYDEYKLIEELDAINNNTSLFKYTWQPKSLGLDVPLTVQDSSENKIYYYHTDSNKNIINMTDVEGNIVAHYEYDPYGSLCIISGGYAEKNPFRFSSEYYDKECDLIYYNYRYYCPSLGRWLNRDPLEEQGGKNLYAFVKNNPINQFDHLGLRDWSDYWNAPANWAMTGELFPSDEQLAAAYEGFTQGIKCWWTCEGKVHKCVLGIMLTVTETLSSPGFLAARIPKPGRIVNPKSPYTSVARGLGKLLNWGESGIPGRSMSEQIGRNIGRSPIVRAMKGALVAALVAEGAISISCGISCM